MPTTRSRRAAAYQRFPRVALPMVSYGFWISLAGPALGVPSSTLTTPPTSQTCSIVARQAVRVPPELPSNSQSRQWRTARSMSPDRARLRYSACSRISRPKESEIKRDFGVQMKS